MHWEHFQNPRRRRKHGWMTAFGIIGLACPRRQIEGANNLPPTWYSCHLMGLWEATGSSSVLPILLTDSEAPGSLLLLILPSRGHLLQIKLKHISCRKFGWVVAFVLIVLHNSVNVLVTDFQWALANSIPKGKLVVAQAFERCRFTKITLNVSPKCVKMSSKTDEWRRFLMRVSNSTFHCGRKKF